MKKKVTLKEIARELNVSVSTVSKALKDSEEISVETRERIQAFAKLLNYKPNSIALSLRNQATKSIGILIPQIVNHYFAKVIQGIEEEAQKQGYSSLIAVSNNSFEKEVLHMQNLANGSIDGFILSVAKETLLKKDYHHFKEVLARGIPIIMFDRTIPEIDCDKVIIDDIRAAQRATERLIASGCKQILLITTEDFISVGKLRKQGYINALLEENRKVNPDLILEIKDDFSKEEAEAFIIDKMRGLLKKYPDIDGILGVNEFYTIFALNYLKDKGYKVPENISAICFSDGDLPKYANPSISAISQYGEEIGRASARLLIDKLEKEKGPEHNQTIIINTKIIERESTKKLN